MSFRLRNLRIGSRLYLALTLPVVAMLTFGAWAALQKAAEWSEAETAEKAGRYVIQVSALVHELQRERGASATFLSSKGALFGEELRTQRMGTEAAVKNLNMLGNDGGVEAADAGLRKTMADAKAGLEKTIAGRAAVDALSLDASQAAAAYTQAIGRYLDVVGAMSRLSANPQIASSITAHLSLMRGKESAGQERAVGASGFASGRFAPDLIERFLGLISSQEAYFIGFRGLARPEEVDALDKTLTSDAAAAVAKFRKAALDNAVNGTALELKAAEWFQQSSKRIDLLKGVEDRSATGLMDLAASVKREAAAALTMALAALAATLVVLAIMTPLIARSIVLPIGHLTQVMARLSEGNLDVTVEGADSRSETGIMARAVKVFQQNALDKHRLVAEQEELKKRAETERRQGMLDLAGNFQSSVLGVVKSVAGAAQQLQATAQSMSAAVEQTSRQAASVANAAQEASTNVQTVASAAEELSASIGEISGRVADSANISRSAVHEAERANAMVRGLAEAAERIGEVVNLINDIASQTNLLALNATIEAARAGDAGKGFAVVANEVKNLANQTARATDEIGQQIGSVQQETRNAVSAIESIGATIKQINDIASAIAAAVEEQEAVTQEIARSVAQASSGTQEVSLNIKGVSQAATETGAAAGQVLAAAGDMGNQASNLNREVEVFLASVRKAG
ncbi:MAG: nitrate- and nitrite sensing domain-containing protein [Rhodospirillales bacterium]|nr:nitrate- and nitrite sensing domain-containing protein [Rhodospirillales bacterium]